MNQTDKTAKGASKQQRRQEVDSRGFVDFSGPYWLPSGELSLQGVHDITESVKKCAPDVLGRVAGNDLLAIVNATIQTLISTPSQRRWRLDAPPEVAQQIKGLAPLMASKPSAAQPKVPSTSGSKAKPLKPTNRSTSKGTGAVRKANIGNSKGQPLVPEKVVKQQPGNPEKKDIPSPPEVPVTVPSKKDGRGPILKKALRTFHSQDGQKLTELLKRPLSETEIRQDVENLSDEQVAQYHADPLKHAYKFLGYFEDSNIIGNRDDFVGMKAYWLVDTVNDRANTVREQAEARNRKIERSRVPDGHQTAVSHIVFNEDFMQASCRERVEYLRSELRQNANAVKLFPLLGDPTYNVFLSFDPIDSVSRQPGRVQFTFVKQDSPAEPKTKVLGRYTVVTHGDRSQNAKVKISHIDAQLCLVAESLVGFLRPGKQGRKTDKPSIKIDGVHSSSKSNEISTDNTPDSGVQSKPSSGSPQNSGASPMEQTD